MGKVKGDDYVGPLASKPCAFCGVPGDFARCMLETSERAEPVSEVTPEVLIMLRMAMIAFPHQRVGQLIVNATGRSDPFYVTDEELSQKLEAYVRGGGTPWAK